VQIAERLEAELTSAETGTFKPDDVSLPSLHAKPASALKVLHIQLQPAELGTVTIRMSLKRDVLEVELDVSRQQTAHMLRQDQEALSKLLQSAGYVLDGMTVHIVEPDRAASPGQPNIQNNHATAQSSLHSQPGWSQSDGKSGMQGQAGHDARRSSVPSDTSANAVNDATGARPSNGGVYL
jgi:chemotaxis protein MotD